MSELPELSGVSGVGGAGELGALDRPERPASPGAWDERSEEWLTEVPAAGPGETGSDEGRAGERGAGEVDVLEADVHEVALHEADVHEVAVHEVAVHEVKAEAEVRLTAEARSPRPVGAGVRGGPGAAGTAGPGALAAMPAPAGADRRPANRRGAVDPVKALMHRHRELCERAVDPLEIAAGLEAHGVTDRTAARFRHRDVFSLAEEMFARMPRDGETGTRPDADTHPGSRAGARADWAVLALLPGALCTAAVVGLRLTEGQPRLAVAAAGALAVALGLRAAVRRGPLHTAFRTTSGTRAWTCWLIAYALLGDGLLSSGVDGGPDGPWPPATAPVLALALACAPAAWCAHLFAVRARRRLNASRGLAEFADSVQPTLLGAFALFLCALVGLLALCAAVLDEPAPYAGAGALGALLLLARLLTVHGFTHAPAVVLGAAGAAEATALATVFAGRLPGCSFLATPVETVVGAWGPGAVPALACGAAALVLLVHSTRTLTRASAHATPSGAP